MPTAITPDEAMARAPVAAMAAFVDLQDWERLPRCFTARVLVDYTSLWGGEPQEVTVDELLDQWRALLPGFDATRHELGPISVRVNGDVAEAEAAVSGTHLLGSEAWIVEGRYRCGLARENGDWRIRALTYANERESGERALTERAKARVQ